MKLSDNYKLIYEKPYAIIVNKNDETQTIRTDDPNLKMVLYFINDLHYTEHHIANEISKKYPNRPYPLIYGNVRAFTEPLRQKGIIIGE